MKNPLSLKRNRLFAPVCLALASILTIAAYFGLHAFAVSHTAFMENVYSRMLFRVNNSLLSHIFGVFPFSAAELAVYLLAATAVLCVIIILINLKRIFALLNARILLTILFAIIFSASCIFLQFQLIWGFNHYRQPLGVTLGLDVQPRSKNELIELCYYLAEKSVSLRKALPESAEGVVDLGTNQTLLQQTPQAMDTLKAILPAFDTPQPKAIYTDGLSYLGISGIYVPFTYEANVNAAQPPLFVPLTACHESAHVMGFAREDEANFLGFLACYNSQNPAFAYSGFMLALTEAGNQLKSVDNAAYSELVNSYSDGMMRDFSAYNQYWTAFEGPIENAANNANDSYLKMHGIEDGIKSYGRMTDLMIAGFQAGWFI